MDTVIEFIADLILLGETGIKLVLVFMGIMATIWTFQVLKDPAKQLDLAMQLFKNIFVWTWKGVLLCWAAVVWVFNFIMKVLNIIFATVRDFFVSKN